MGRADRYPSGSRRSGQAIIFNSSDGAAVGGQHILGSKKTGR